MVRHNEKEFTERVREASDQNQEKTVKECKQKINKAQKRHKELDGLVKKLYEGNATGKIPDKHFTRLLAEYDEEQTGLETSILNGFIEKVIVHEGEGRGGRKATIRKGKSVSEKSPTLGGTKEALLVMCINGQLYTLPAMPTTTESHSFIHQYYLQ